MESCCQSKSAIFDDSAVPVGASELSFRVSGIDYSEEVAAIERAVKPLRGVLEVRANIVASTVTIEADAKSAVIVGHRPHADCKGEVPAFSQWVTPFVRMRLRLFGCFTMPAVARLSC
jgi:copper chaperone CopZ